MYIPSTNWREQIKNAIQEMSNAKSYVLDGTVTSVNTTLPYSVKVNLEPYEIETGWLKMVSPYAGNGFGIVLPPPAEGTHVRVIFDMGDINNGVVVGATYNDVSVSPNVNFGDAAIFHQSGSQIVMKSDGSIVFTSKGEASLTLGADKTVTINGNTTQSW
jgi:phage baseplate assembly protein V